MNNLIDYYSQKKEKLNEQISIESKNTQLVFYSRLFLFLGTVFTFFYFFENNPAISYLSIFVLVVIFLFLLRIELKTNRKINHLKNLIKVCEIEIELLNNNFEKFDEGKEFLDKQHDYISDLDIFGRRSIFQILNRTSTYTGRTKLAHWLSNPFLEKQIILQRQEIVKDLAKRPEWCLNFIALGIENKENATDKEVINEWLNQENIFSNTFFKIAAILLPVLTIAAFILYLADIIAIGPYLTLFFIQIMIVGSKTKIISRIHDQLSRKFDSIEKYRTLISEIESEKFDAEGLNKLKLNLVSNTENASIHINQLKKISDTLNARLNIVVAALLNGIFLWDINVMIKLENWRNKHKTDFLKWIDVIGEFDAFISLALYTHNNSNYTFPKIETDDFTIQAKSIGHPLLHRSKLVSNDYNIEGLPQVDLLTGANMAGKSTFLRTIGVNLVIAMTGAPVCAEEFRFTPILLFTSLRTNDSLQDNESFFYAELKRLRLLIQHYEKNQKIFFLLDEILKGTNSKDQHQGSEALIKKILKLNGVGIVATHDVELARLQAEFPNKVRNLCFEIVIDNDKLNFDYKIKSGVCATMNASYLMKKMEIID